MGGSSSSSTETSQTSYPQWTQDAQARTYGVGTGMLENFLRNPQYATAGFTTDQMKGFDLARDTVRQAYTASPLTAPGNPNLNAAYGTAAQGSAAQLSPTGYQSFMNPYMQDVVNTTRDTIQRDYADKSAGLSAKYAAGNSFGGSGEALAQGQLARGANETLASTTAALMSQGFDKATATAMANTQLQQQTGLANQNAQQQMGLANMAAENAMRTTGADYGLKRVQVDDTLRTTDQAREMSALQQLLQGGNQQQALAQRSFETPWTMLQMLMGLTPQQMNSQTVSNKETESSKSPFDMIMGVGNLISGFGKPTGIK